MKSPKICLYTIPGVRFMVDSIVVSWIAFIFIWNQSSKWCDLEKCYSLNYRLGSHSHRPKLQEIVALPQPTNIGCIFSPCRSISTPNRRISIILALHTLKTLLSNVEDQNHTPNILNYSIYVVQSSPTNANHFSKCRRLHCYHHVTVCCMSCFYLPPLAKNVNLWPRWGQFNPKFLCIASPVLVHPFPKVLATKSLSKQYHTIIFIIVHPAKIIKRENGLVRTINISWGHKKHPQTRFTWSCKHLHVFNPVEQMKGRHYVQ